MANGQGSTSTTNSRLPKSQRKRQLLAVARQVLARDGYYKTTMVDIAREAGVTKPVLYQHFASKRDLYTAVLNDIGDRLRAAVLDAIDQSAPPRQQVSSGIAAYTTFVDTDREGFQLLFCGNSRQDDEWSAIAGAVERSLAEAIADLIVVDGVSFEHRIALGHGIVAMAEGMMRYWLLDPESNLDREQLVQSLVSLMWGGLRNLHPGAAGPPTNDRE